MDDPTDRILGPASNLLVEAADSFQSYTPIKTLIVYYVNRTILVRTHVFHHPVKKAIHQRFESQNQKLKQDAMIILKSYPKKTDLLSLAELFWC